jgi:serine/threonine protein kinase
LLGCGSFGSVYLVENIFTREKFALKAVFTDSCRSIISEELDILTKLNSKYIISLREVFNNELITFFVTEYCEV